MSDLLDEGSKLMQEEINTLATNYGASIFERREMAEQLKCKIDLQFNHIKALKAELSKAGVVVRAAKELMDDFNGGGIYIIPARRKLSNALTHYRGSE